MNYKKGSFVTVPNKDQLRGNDAISQVVFLWLCSYADEDGICFPSRAKLAKDCGVSVDTIDRKIKGLMEGGFIEKTIRKDGDVNKSNLYQILLIEQGVASENGQGSRTNHPRGSLRNHTLTKSSINSIQLTSDVPSQGIVSVIDLWEPLNHNFKDWYRNKTQRQAIEDLIKKYGQQKVENMVKQLPSIVAKKFAPKITTPHELKRDLPKLLIFIKQEEQKKRVIV